MGKSLNVLTSEIHELAVSKGWWDEPRSFGEVIALCHSELSEALEEDRAGRPVLWLQGDKPEGTATEMADCIIRILDWAGHENIDMEQVIKLKHEYNKTRPYKHGKKY